MNRTPRAIHIRPLLLASFALNWAISGEAGWSYHLVNILAIARFAAPEGLTPAGNQLFRPSIDSGPAAIATPGSQGNGTIVAAALEQSNVQIAQEFIELISTQRSFQANTRVITASDTLLSDLINIIR